MSLHESEKVSYPHVKRIVNPTGPEIDQLVTVLVEAFEGDPFSAILLGGNLDLGPSEIRANVQAALIGGQVHAILVGPNPTDIVGISIWYPPGTSTFSSEEERAAGWNQFLETIPDRLRTWWMDYFIPTVSQLSSKALGAGYLLNSWHLHLFGVLKAHQGKGYGRALFEFAERQAKSTRSPMVVETTTEVDVKIYKRFGFRICSETDITSAVGNGHMWLMLKENTEEQHVTG
ncbi:hypothetical protein BDZ97DRAFT_1825649 [Flammula alnicola]|nr:hypothetical protein BDZ97DRAFT_1825649 [Flammula alnicola]